MFSYLIGSTPMTVQDLYLIFECIKEAKVSFKKKNVQYFQGLNDIDHK
jgi:hypothetical protein